MIVLDSSTLMIMGAAAGVSVLLAQYASGSTNLAPYRPLIVAGALGLGLYVASRFNDVQPRVDTRNKGLSRRQKQGRWDPRA